MREGGKAQVVLPPGKIAGAVGKEAPIGKEAKRGGGEIRQCSEGWHRNGGKEPLCGNQRENQRGELKTKCKRGKRGKENP